MSDNEEVLLERRFDKILYRTRVEVCNSITKEKLRVIEEYIMTMPDSNVHITYQNYKSLIIDVEVRAFFEEVFLKEREIPDYEVKFLFLMAFSSQGYNFGQFRLMSHLLKLGYSRENIKIFPLHLEDGKYNYNDKELENVLQKYNPDYVCETTYVGWDSEIIRLNKYIKSKSKAIIMTGGPFTLSHFSFCKDKLCTDIIFLGHGEYVFEAFLKACSREHTLWPNISQIPGVAYANDINERVEKVGIINKYMDLLKWDYQLLSELYQIAPVINLFTSEECNGNCIFCYRQSTMKNNTMSNGELYKRLNDIVNLDIFKKERKTVYLRFFDDDFFANVNRDVFFVNQLSKITTEKVRIFELTFSIRSIYRLEQKYKDEIYKSIKKLQLKRVTIGVDGFNNNDLRRLKKGYRIDRVFSVIKKFSLFNIPVLMYAILTTFETDYKDLFITLLNMLKLCVNKGVYVGPAITPCICVHSGNAKLYPQFQGKNQIYLIADSFEETMGNEKVMSAQILPRDSFVRAYLKVIGLPTDMESAYILPLMCVYMEQLAMFANIIYKLIYKDEYRLKFNKMLQYVRNKYAKLLNREEKTDRLDMNKSNRINQLLRIRHDIDEYLHLIWDDEKLKSEYENIIQIYNEYCSFYEMQKVDIIDEGLAGAIKRLSPLPGYIFEDKLDDKERIKKRSEDRKKINITEEEYRIFRRLVKI